MKTFLSFSIMLLCAVQAWAASPSFQSFDTNDFIVVQPLISSRHTNSGGTNVFVSTTIVYTNVTNLIENSFITITNSYVTNTFTTNFFDNSVIVVTNTTVDNSFVTITNTTINQTFVTNFFDNSVIIITNTSVTINGTNVPTVNPTIGRLPFKSGTNAFGDSALFFIDTNTVGAVEADVEIVGVTNLVNGGVVISVDSGSGYGILTNTPPGSGFLFNDGTDYSWIDSGSIGLWTNKSGILQPIDLTLPLMFTNQIIFGPGSTNVLYRSGSDLVYTNGTAGQFYLRLKHLTGGDALFGVTSGGPFITSGSVFPVTIQAGGGVGVVFNPSGVYPNGTMSLGQNSSPGLWDSQYFKGTLYQHNFNDGAGSYSRLAISHTGTNGASVFDSQSAGSGGGSARPFNFNINGTNLYTLSSSVTDPTITVSTAAGTTARVEAFGSSGYFKGGTFAYFVNSSTKGLLISNTSIQPVDDGTMNLGGITSGESWFLNTGVSSTNFVRGFLSGATNISVLATSHTGTNGIVSINSKGAGTAGPGRPIVMSIDSTNIFKVDGNSGASTTGLLIYENGSEQRVTVGAADSGGAGFRVLRIPN